MFDLSLSEIILVILVALLVIKPKDVPVILRNFKEWKNKASHFKREALEYIKNIDGAKEIHSELRSLKEEVKTIVDLDGNPQRVYDIDDIRNDLHQITALKNKISHKNIKKQNEE